jgi:citrate lyase subunit beta/citryl-CoA lyase
MRSYLSVTGAPFVVTAADALIVGTALEDLAFAAGLGPAVWVRIGAGEAGHHDAHAVVPRIPGLAGVCVPGAGSAAELAALGPTLAEAEEAAGLPVGRVALMPVLDTADGILAAAEIACAPRVVRLQLGEVRLCADLRLRPGPDERELLWARSMVVLAGAAAGIEPPIGDVCPDPDLFRDSTEALRRSGFGGRVCLDEEQVAMANQLFANA